MLDRRVEDLIQKEIERQKVGIELIASENYSLWKHVRKRTL